MAGIVRQQQSYRMERATELVHSSAQLGELVADQGSRATSSTPALTEEQLVALQCRLSALHSASLLVDSELWELEDLVADCIALKVRRRRNRLPNTVSLRASASASASTSGLCL